jgi:hypothetical protein
MSARGPFQHGATLDHFGRKRGRTDIRVVDRDYYRDAPDPSLPCSTQFCCSAQERSFAGPAQGRRSRSVARVTVFIFQHRPRRRTSTTAGTDETEVNRPVRCTAAFSTTCRQCTCRIALSFL